MIFEIEKFSKGYTPNKKFVIRIFNRKFLVKIINRKYYLYDQTLKKALLKECEQSGLPIPKILLLNSVNGNKIFSCYEWIQGTMLNDFLPQISKTEQYKIGVEMGRLLKKLHSVPISEYISGTSMATCDNSISIVHGDFHISNILKTDDFIRIIDWDNIHLGNPFEDFNRILINAEVSPEYACGQIDGYFDGKPNLEFWDFLKQNLQKDFIDIPSFCLDLLPNGKSITEHNKKLFNQQYSDGTVSIPKFYKEKKYEF